MDNAMRAGTQEMQFAARVVAFEQDYVNALDAGGARRIPPDRESLTTAGELEVYVKDTHWLAEKSLVVMEKVMLTLDEVRQDKIRPHMMSFPSDLDQPASLALGFQEVLDGVSEQLSLLVHQSVAEAVQSIGRQPPQTVDLAENGSVSPGLPQDDSSSALAACSKILSLQREATDNAVQHHKEIKVIFKEILNKLDVSYDTRRSLPSQEKPKEIVAAKPKELVAAKVPPSDSTCLVHTQQPASTPKAKPKTSKKKHSEDWMQRARRMIKTGSASSTEEAGGKSSLAACIESTAFEMTFAVLIVVNAIVMCVEAEFSGWSTGYKLGVQGAQAAGDTADKFFEITGLMFTIAFTIEVVAKLVAQQFRFMQDGWNIFDSAIIAVAWIELIIEVDFPVNPMLLRLLKLCRLARLTNHLNAYEIFDNLVFMVKGIKTGGSVLLWVATLLIPIMSACALGMNYSVLDFMEDESKDIEHRLTCWNYFGTFAKAMISMFEVTFGNWVPICRFLYNNVDSKYALGFMVYQLVMKIAVIRVMYGVFLKVTFDCASSDDEAVIAKKRRENRKFAEQMRSLMTKFDTSKDGYMSRDEFRTIENDVRVTTWLSAMELEMHDAELVFDLADDGDGRLSVEELAHGFTILRGGARSMDIWALMSLTKKLMEKVETMQPASAMVVGSDEPDASAGTQRRASTSFFQSSLGQARLTSS